MNLFEWLTENEAWISLLIESLSMIITTVLTGVIIWQTSRLSKEQQRLEKNIFEKEQESRERQMKIDMLHLRYDIYISVQGIIQLCRKTTELESNVNKLSVKYEDVCKWFDATHERFINNQGSVASNILAAKFVFSELLADSLTGIGEQYVHMCQAFRFPIQLKEILDKKGQISFEKTAEHYVKEAFACCKNILNNADEIIRELDREIKV